MVQTHAENVIDAFTLEFSSFALLVKRSLQRQIRTYSYIHTYLQIVTTLPNVHSYIDKP